MRELMNFANYAGRYYFCFVTKIKNGSKKATNFNLQHKTNLSPSYVLHIVHSSQPAKLAELAESQVKNPQNAHFTRFLGEYIEHWLTYMMARRFFDNPAAASV
ncbi:MAG TPA: hypothetical protein DCZ08_03630 [Anaerolineaceae bacterium]|nr:hypothetical protein [Anaerolineaceae bacterium]